MTISSSKDQVMAEIFVTLTELLYLCFCALKSYSDFFFCFVFFFFFCFVLFSLRLNKFNKYIESFLFLLLFLKFLHSSQHKLEPGVNG